MVASKVFAALAMFVLVLGLSSAIALASAAADLNNDCVVDAKDLNTFALGWRQSVDRYPHLDIWRDGKIDGGDLNLIAISWGPVPGCPQCGDGKIDAQNGERCDDGNNVDGDGCSAFCVIEDGHGGRCSTDAQCASGVCDLTEVRPGDTTGVLASGLCEAAHVCGNYKIEGSEECDDGNTRDGDGCSSMCSYEGDPGLACEVAGHSRQYSRIANGQACVIGDSPVVKLVLYAGDLRIRSCSGTIIAPDAVLTAAHCFRDDVGRSASSAKVFTGQGTYHSRSLHKYAEYVSADPFPRLYDVAIVKTSAPMTSRVSSLYRGFVRRGERAVIAGYGQGGGNLSINAATTRVHDDQDGILEIRYLEGSSDGAPCRGDSGGPLFVERSGSWLLTGVVSMASSDSCRPDYTAYFVSLTTFAVRNFIDSVVEGVTYFP